MKGYTPTRMAIGLIIISLVSATGALASTSQSALDRAGTLWKAKVVEELVITRYKLGQQPESYVIPGTYGEEIQHPQLAVTSRGNVVICWQQGEEGTERVNIAVVGQEGVVGPFTLTGGDSIQARNPSLMVRTAKTQLADEEGQKSWVETTMIMVAWWAEGAESGPMLTAVPLDAETGEPVLSELSTWSLSADLPYGVGCEIEESEELKHPRLYLDPATAHPQVLFVDFDDCLFAIQELKLELPEETQEPGDLTTQRRRHIVVFGVRDGIAIPPSIRLDSSEIVAGPNRSLVAYWDVESGLAYMTMDAISGWSEVRVLPVSDEAAGADDWQEGDEGTTEALSHEEAVKLVRRLATAD